MIVSSVDKYLLDRRSLFSLGLGAMVASKGSNASTLQEKSETFDTDLDFSGSFDPKNSQHNTLAFCKLMADTRNDIDTCGYFKGDVLAYLGPNRKLEPLFGYEGFGMTKTEQTGSYKWKKFHKEVAYYTDLKTGEVLNEWYNPIIDEKVRVIHVHNDAVNSVWAPTYSFMIGPKKVTKEFVFPWLIMGDNAVVDFGVNTTVPATLQPEQWPRESHGRITQVMEAIQIHTKLSELTNAKKTSIQSTGSWQRIAPWLPWMLMGQHSGHLFYKTVTRKMPEGVSNLPSHIYDYTKENFPDYFNAPTEWKIPNVSSYEVYEREMKPQPFREK